VRYYPQKREDYGAKIVLCEICIPQLHHSDEFRNLIRMEPGTFEKLLSKVEQLIGKSLHIIFRGKQQIRSTLIPEPCQHLA
jgi:hypothetical protein